MQIPDNHFFVTKYFFPQSSAVRFTVASNQSRNVFFYIKCKADDIYSTIPNTRQNESIVRDRPSVTSIILLLTEALNTEMIINTNRIDNKTKKKKNHSIQHIHVHTCRYNNKHCTVYKKASVSAYFD